MTQLIRSTAILSQDGLYRYELTRRWDFGDRLALFIMLNPSNADAAEDDPTIRRCRGFAKREGCDGIRVVNLYAFRATKPPVMYAAADTGIDIVGPENDRYITAALNMAEQAGTPVIAAWGASARNPHRIYKVRQLDGMDRAQALGFTGKGQPRHPLMLAGDTELVPFGGAK